MCVYIYIYTHIYVCVYIYIYVCKSSQALSVANFSVEIRVRNTLHPTLLLRTASRDNAARTL